MDHILIYKLKTIKLLKKTQVKVSGPGFSDEFLETIIKA